MKGKILMVVAGIFISAFPSLRGIRVEASSSSLDFGTVTYFQNLDKYSPYNLEGSCSYVSLSMMLAYYDNFLNDNIISGKYERHDEFMTFDSALCVSPGIEKTSPIQYTKNYDALKAEIERLYPGPDGEPDSTQYQKDPNWQELNKGQSNELWDYIHSLSDTDFQMKIITTIADMPGGQATRDNFWTAGSHTDWQKILDAMYGEGNIAFSYAGENDVQEKYGYESLAELAEAKIDEGYILHVGIYNPDPERGGSHGVTAYYRDSEGIHAHWGWGASDNDNIIDLETYQITVVGWLDFPGFPLEHSQNYVINGVGYCGCGEHAIHSYEEFYGPGTYNLPLGGFSISRAGIGFPGGIVDPGKEPPDIPERPKIIVPENSHLAICPCGHYEIQRHYTYEGSAPSGNPFCSACGVFYSPLRLVEREIDI